MCKKNEKNIKLLILCFLSIVFSNIKSFAETVSPYDQVYKEYRREVQSLKGSPSTNEFRDHWITQFKKVSSLPVSSKDIGIRLVVLGELGALQRGIGESEQALDTFKKLELEARDSRRWDDCVEAIDTQLSIIISTKNSAEQIIEIASKLDSAYRELINSPQYSKTQEERTKYLAKYSDDLVQITRAYIMAGDELFRNGQESGNVESLDQAKVVWNKANKSIETAISLGNIGNVPIEKKYFQSAKAKLKIGDNNGASLAYRQILESNNDNVISKLWIAHLELKTRFENNSAEYQKGILEILTSYPNDEYKIPLKQDLAMSYIRTENFNDAIRIFETILGKGENEDVEATNLSLMAQCYFQLKQYAIAKGLFQEIIEKYPKSGAATEAKIFLKDIESAMYIWDRESGVHDIFQQMYEETKPSSEKNNISPESTTEKKINDDIAPDSDNDKNAASGNIGTIQPMQRIVKEKRTEQIKPFMTPMILSIGTAFVAIIFLLMFFIRKKKCKK